MRSNKVIGKIFLTTCVVLVCVTLGFGQGLFGKIKDKVKGGADQVKSEAKDQTHTGITIGYDWARIEVRASWEENGEKKYETRVYFSNVNPYQTGDAKMVENLWKYFNDGVAEPMKTRGIELKFYESDIKIYPFSYSYETVAEAEKERSEKMEADKANQYASIYTFVWKYNSSATGEEMTQPKRVFSFKPAPSMENMKVGSNNNAADREAKKNAEKKEYETSQQQKQIWGYAILKVRVKNPKGEEFTRIYVSEIAPVTRDDYNAYYNTDERYIKPRIWEYFAATVVAAAKKRGEEIEEPYDSSIMFQFSLDRDVNGQPWFKPKSVLDEPRTREITYAKDDQRQVFYFNWDPSGKNIQADLQREMKRGVSATLAN